MRSIRGSSDRGVSAGGRSLLQNRSQVASSSGSSNCRGPTAPRSKPRRHRSDKLSKETDRQSCPRSCFRRGSAVDPAVRSAVAASGPIAGNRGGADDKVLDLTKPARVGQKGPVSSCLRSQFHHCLPLVCRRSSFVAVRHPIRGLSAKLQRGGGRSHIAEECDRSADRRLRSLYAEPRFDLSRDRLTRHCRLNASVAGAAPSCDHVLSPRARRLPADQWLGRRPVRRASHLPRGDRHFFARLDHVRGLRQFSRDSSSRVSCRVSVVR